MSRKIDNLLDGLERNANLTKDGRAWLVAACDPFHDQDINIAGYPDLITASTVVQLIKKQVQISVPPTTGQGAVATGANWDCSVVLFPSFVPQVQGASYTIGSTGVVASTSAIAVSAYTGGLVYNAGPQGVDLWPGAGETGVGTINATSNSIGITEYCKGSARIIGMAFEVVNTTAEINLQGQVTAYRMPTQKSITQLQIPVATTPNTYFTTSYLAQRYPPSNIAAAQLLYGSRSWAAKEGGYVVARQNSDLNPINQPEFYPNLWTLTDFVSGSTAFANSQSANQISSSLGQSDIYAPFDISGLHFTGLSYATTLTVNVRWLVERMPSSNESDLVVLATPSSCYDPLALELYARCMINMPPGVMLKENPLGEWFRSALSKVAELAPKIGGFVGNFVPGAQAIGESVGYIAKNAKKMIPKESKKDKQNEDPKKLMGSASTTRLLLNNKS